MMMPFSHLIIWFEIGLIKPVTKMCNLSSMHQFVPSLSHLVENVNLVVGQVEEDHTAQRSKRSLLHLDDIAVLQVEVCEVRCVQKCSSGQHLQVIVPQVQFQCNLSGVMIEAI